MQTYKDVYEKAQLVEWDLEETQQFHSQNEKERHEGKNKQVTTGGV